MILGKRYVFIIILLILVDLLLNIIHWTPVKEPRSSRWLNLAITFHLSFFWASIIHALSNLLHYCLNHWVLTILTASSRGDLAVFNYWTKLTLDKWSHKEKIRLFLGNWTRFLLPTLTSLDMICQFSHLTLITSSQMTVICRFLVH